MRCLRSTLVRGAPSRYRLRRLRLRSTAPRYRNSASVSLSISSRVVPVTCFARDVYQVHPYRDSCKKLVHELLLQNFAIENRYLNSYKCTIQLFGRVVLRSLQLIQFETYTSNELRSHASFDTLSGVFRFRAFSPYSGRSAGSSQLTARSSQR